MISTPAASDSSDDDDDDDDASRDAPVAYEALRQLVADVHAIVDASHAGSLDALWSPELNVEPLDWQEVEPAAGWTLADNEAHFQLLQRSKPGAAQLLQPAVQLNADHTFAFELRLPGKPRAAVSVTYLNKSSECVPRAAATAQVWCVFAPDSNVVRYSADLRTLVTTCARSG